jgi:pimeloyl-ACP methyl ester carboxylesterase
MQHRRFNRNPIRLLIGLTSVLASTLGLASQQLIDDVSHHYADNDGVKIHYVKTGNGPLVVMIHGFPDYWYSWRAQMEALKDNFTVVAMDQRGYNQSDQPEGVAAYAMPNLVADVAAVVAAEGADKATIVGHDWGGAVAWQVAFARPEMVETLVIMNLPHPNGLARELANNEEQQRNSDYAQRFIAGSADDPTIIGGNPMTAQTLSGWVRDAAVRKQYVQAFERSDFAAMLNFYKANYPRTGENSPVAPSTPPPPLAMPLLIFHGLEDTALHSDGLNNTWDWAEKDVTIVTVPGAGHFVQQDAPTLVSGTMRWWLSNRIRR